MPDELDFTAGELACPVCGQTALLPLEGGYQCPACQAVLVRRPVDQQGVCVHCAQGNPPGAQFCGHCGQPLSALSPVRFCPQCGQHHTQAFAYCTRCGHDLKQEQPASGEAHCPACGRIVAEEAVYCAHCGHGRGAYPAASATNPYAYCPACGAPLSTASDLCLKCGTDASDYIDLVRSLTRDQVNQIVEEEEARMAWGMTPPKRKRGPADPPLTPSPRLILLGILLGGLVILLLVATISAQLPR